MAEFDLNKELVSHQRWAEGIRQFPYEDSVGKITIGVGRNLEDVGLSQEEIGKCNTEHLTAALASANIALDAQKAAYEAQLAERDRLAGITQNGLEIASEALLVAEPEDRLCEE